MAIRTLVLSGGGGRGAFHVGVQKYLAQEVKEGVDAAHQGAWSPEIIVGTSIGAVNGAAITQDIPVETLERYWAELEEKDVEALPPGMNVLARWSSNAVYSRILKDKLPTIDRADATSTDPPESWPLLPLLPPALSERLIGRWSNLLDTGPLKKTLRDKWGIDPDKLSAAEKTLLISATNVQTGELTIFSNKPIYKHGTDEIRKDVIVGIDIDRILASCSIPLVYPWTQVQDAYYWDGAVVANTPLGPALDAASEKHDIDVPMEAVVVLMTPWWEKGSVPASRQALPGDFGEAITWTLDWALLSSFRADLKITRHFNDQAKKDMENGQSPRYRHVEPIIVAPDEFLPVERIIDYDEPESRGLMAWGYNAARAAFQEAFPAD